MDEKQNFIKGMTVTIPDKLKYTKAKYGISEPMKQLIGTSQEIEKLIEDDDFLIKRWLWGKEDFQILETHIETSEEIENIPEIKNTKISEPLKKTKPRKVLLKDLISR